MLINTKPKISIHKKLLALIAVSILINQTSSANKTELAAEPKVQILTATPSSTASDAGVARSMPSIASPSGPSTTPSSKIPAYQPSTAIVKLTEQATKQLTFATTNKVARTSASAMPALTNLMTKSACTMERLFPHAPAHEAKQVKAGLHKWFRMKCDVTAKTNDLVSNLKGSAGVEHVEPEYIYELHNGSLHQPPNDRLYHNQWSYHNEGEDGGTVDADIDLVEAWTITTGDPSVIVAISDVGTDIDHPDLRNTLWLNLGEDINNDGQLNDDDVDGIDNDGNGYADDFWGWDFNEADNDPRPRYNSDSWNTHGTIVSSIIAATTNDSIGMAGIAGGDGVNPGVRIMIVKGIKSAPAIVYAANNGARVLNASWGGTGNPAYLSTAYEYFTQYAGNGLGGLAVASAGNDNHSTIQYPAGFPAVMSVAATDRNDNRADFSNFGSWVEIAAPGKAIVGAYSSSNSHHYHFIGDGTSFSSPHVAGVAALIMSKYPHLSSPQIRQILTESADHIADLSISGRRLNAHQALLLAEKPQQGLYIWETTKDFGWQTIHQTSVQPFSIVNPSDQPYTAHINVSDHGAFSVNESSVTIPARSYHVVDITYTAQTIGHHTAEVIINYGAKQHTITLTGAAHHFAPQPIVYTTSRFQEDDRNFLPLFLANCGDYNNDGRMDLMTSGLHSEGANTFEMRLHDAWSTNLAGISVVSENTVYSNHGRFNPTVTGTSIMQPADIDGDSDLDITLAGEWQSPTQDSNGYNTHLLTRTYRNIHNNIFEEDYQLDLLGFAAENIDWVDLDNDGDLDTYFSGTTLVQNGSRLERSHESLVLLSQNNAQNFTSYGHSATGLYGYFDAATSWLDLNNDMNLDFITHSGKDLYGLFHTQLMYGQAYSLEFDEPIWQTNSNLIAETISFADYDHDGEIELFSHKNTLNSSLQYDYTQTFLKRNQNKEYVEYIDRTATYTNNNTFTHRGYADQFVKSVDITADGYYDILVHMGGGRVGIFENDGFGYFNLYSLVETPAHRFDVCDVDNDGDLDIYYSVGSEIGYAENIGALKNEPPTPPLNLRHSVVYDEILFAWDSGNDLETPAPALTYNLRVGNHAGRDQVMPSHSLPNGKRLINSSGNVENAKYWQLSDLTNGQYNWSVQSVDAGWAGSPFQQPKSFTINTDTSGLADISLSASILASSNTSQTIELRVENQGGDTITGFAARIYDSNWLHYDLCNSPPNYHPNHDVWHAQNLTLNPGETHSVILKYCLTSHPTKLLADPLFSAEIIGMDQEDSDSLPKNGDINEDDYAYIRVEDGRPVVDITAKISNVDDTRDRHSSYTITYTISTDENLSLFDLIANISLPQHASIERYVIAPSDAALYDSYTGELEVNTDSNRVDVTIYYHEYSFGNEINHDIEIMEDAVDDPDSIPGNGILVEDDQDSVHLRAFYETNARLILHRLTESKFVQSNGRPGIQLELSISNLGPERLELAKVKLYNRALEDLGFVECGSNRVLINENENRIWEVSGLSKHAGISLKLDYCFQSDGPFPNGQTVDFSGEIISSSHSNNYSIYNDGLQRNEDDITKSIELTDSINTELETSISVTDTRETNGRVKVQYTVTNTGPDMATDVLVQVGNPSGVTYQSSSALYSYLLGHSYDRSTRVMTVNRLPANSSRSVIVYYKDYQKGQDVPLNLTITSAQPALSEQANTSDDSSQLILPAIYDNASLNLDGSINYINHGSHYIRAFIDLTLTNNGPDVLEHALVQTYSDTETYSMPGMQLCNPADHYDASTKQWQVPDLPVSVGDTRQLRLEFCPTGNDYAALTQNLNFAAEVYAASVTSENTIPGNGVQGEADDVELTEGPLHNFFKDIQTLNHSSVAAWADIDGDGDLDLASFDHIGNQNFLFIYQKQGNGRMKPVERYPVGNTRDGILSWGDVDNDGDPDLLATFVSGHNNWRMRLLTNEGSQGGNRFSFAMQTNYGLDQGDAKWHDMDNDGDLDLVVAGHRRVNGVRAIDFQSLLYYHANDNGALATKPLVIVDHYTSSDQLSSGNPVLFDLEIADMNNDGLADVITSSNQNVTIRYNDLSSANFLSTKQILAQQTGIGQLSNGVELAITDCNGDTNPDLVVTQLTDASPSSGNSTRSSAFRTSNTTGDNTAAYSTQFQVLVNTGDGNFTVQGTHTWAADVNDLLVYDFSGDSNADYVFTADNQARIVLGGDNCAVQPQTYFIADSAERLWLAEFEQDHQYDLHITGSPNRQMGPARLLRSLHANTPPSSPSTLTVDYVAGKPVLKWNHGGDPDGSNQLTYNLRIGTQPGANDIINAQSYPAAKQQNRIVPAGNLRSQQYFDLSQLLESGRLDGVDTLYWSVQALDPAGGTSAFATEAAVDMRVDLEMSSNVVDNRAENGQVKIQYHVTNTSDVLATDVIVQVETTENLVWRRDNSAPDDRPRFIRTPTGGDWTVSSLAPGQTRMLEVFYTYYADGQIATYGAEVSAMAQNDRDSTPSSGISSTGQAQEDDDTYGELSVMQGPDLKLEHSVVADTRAVNDQIISTVTVTNEGDMGVQYVYFNHAVSNMQVLTYEENEGVTQVRNTAEWFVDTMPPGDSRSITITMHNSQGGAVVERGQVTRMLGADQDSTPNNSSQTDEDDNFSYEHSELVAASAELQTSSYARNYCYQSRARKQAPTCYTLFYYRIRNVGDTTIDQLDLQVERNDEARPIYSYARGNAFDRNNLKWTVSDLKPRQYAYAYMWFQDRSAGKNLKQSLVNVGAKVEKVLTATQLRRTYNNRLMANNSDPNVLEQHSWTSGQWFNVYNW